MIRISRCEVFVAAALCGALMHCAPSRPARSATDVRQVMREGIAAYQEGNHAAFRARFEKANRLRPGHPGIIYNLACGRALVAQHDLDSGRLLRLVRPGDGSAAHLFGDLTVHHSGDLYISDSATPAVYILKENGTEIEEWVRTGEYDALQGMVFAPGGERLFVADYSRGIFTIERASRRLAPLPHPDDVATAGIDGLYFHAGTLIGIQNGVRPNRVVRLRLDPALSRITGSEALEANHPRFDDPTLGVIAAGALFYVANSQWSRFSPQSDQEAVAGRAAPLILKLPL